MLWKQVTPFPSGKSSGVGKWPLVWMFFKYRRFRIIYGGGGNRAAAMADGNDACQLIDPLQQLSAEESAIMIDMCGANEVLLLSERV